MARKRSLDEGPVIAGQILDDAARLFYNKGYDQASIRDLASLSGMSPSTIYHHFRNKQEIAFQVIRRFMVNFNEALLPVVRDSSRPVLDRLDDTVRLHLEISDQRLPELLRMQSFRDILADDQEREIARLARDYHDGVKDLIRQGCARGELTVSDATLVTMGILDMLNGVRAWFDHAGKLSLAEVVRAYTEIVRRTVGAPTSGAE